MDSNSKHPSKPSFFRIFLPHIQDSVFLACRFSFCFLFFLLLGGRRGTDLEMQLHISPSLRHVTVLPAKGFREFIKVKIGSRRLSYRMLFYSLLFFTFLLRFVFVLTAVDSIDGENKCSSIGCLGKRLGPRILGRRLESKIPEVIYQVLEEPVEKKDQKSGDGIPQTLAEFVAEVKNERPDAKTFAIKLKSMVTFLEERTRTAKIQEYLYRHVASSSIPKQLHCLELKLANEHSINANARLQLPLAELVPALVDNSFFHFVLASDNVLAASVVASSLVHNSLHPEKVVLHIITEGKTYAPMQAWFSLHPLTPPGLIAFHGHVHVINPFWHMLGLGYQDNTTVADAESAGVIHFNGRAKPWLDIAFPQLRPLWTKYLNFSDRFIKSCHIRASS